MASPCVDNSVSNSRQLTLCILACYCLSFINTVLDDFSVSATFNESVENMTYSTLFTFTHDVVIDTFGGQGITDNCFLNTTLFSKASKFECTNINYDNFYVVEFNATITLSNEAFPLQFSITFGTEQQVEILTAGE